LGDTGVCSEGDVVELNGVKLSVRSKSSLSAFRSLNRFRRRRKEPFSNMFSALGCNAQYAPFPGRSGLRGTLTKQSLKERLCLNEFCQRCVFFL